jgi:hypothetical protein
MSTPRSPSQQHRERASSLSGVPIIPITATETGLRYLKSATIEVTARRLIWSGGPSVAWVDQVQWPGSWLFREPVPPTPSPRGRDHLRPQSWRSRAANVAVGLLPIRGFPDGNSRPQNVGRDDAPLNACSWANPSSRLSGSQPRLAQAQQGPAAASPAQPRPCPARARRGAPQWIDHCAAALCGPFRVDHATDPAAGSLARKYRPWCRAGHADGT